MSLKDIPKEIKEEVKNPQVVKAADKLENICNKGEEIEQKVKSKADAVGEKIQSLADDAIKILEIISKNIFRKS